MSLIVWSWLFLVVYMSGMLAFGLIGRNRVHDADDFATARAGYGPFFLALAFAATTASGATFLGFPGLAYEHGTAALLSAVLYPAGVYLGVLICMRLVASVGDKFGSRSIPEYLGDRYQSDGIRVIVAIASLLLFFYLAGQLVSGLVMFEKMLGLNEAWALGITAVVLLIYVSLGGAHADILTDGVQGFLMLLIGVLVISRWATLGVMIVCVTMAWMLMDMNIAILVWTGIGGMMAAFAGPLVLGALWSGVTRAGAYTGLLVGLSTFLTLHTGVVDPAWFEGGFLHPVFSWLHGESPNPTSCAALAGLFAIGCTTAVSLATKPLPQAHLASLFRRAVATE